MSVASCPHVSQPLSCTTCLLLGRQLLPGRLVSHLLGCGPPQPVTPGPRVDAALRPQPPCISASLCDPHLPWSVLLSLQFDAILFANTRPHFSGIKSSKLPFLNAQRASPCVLPALTQGRSVFRVPPGGAGPPAADGLVPEPAARAAGAAQAGLPGEEMQEMDWKQVLCLRVLVSVGT